MPTRVRNYRFEPDTLAALERLVAELRERLGPPVTASDALRWLINRHDPRTNPVPITREDLLCFPAVTTAAHRAARREHLAATGRTAPPAAPVGVGAGSDAPGGAAAADRGNDRLS